MSFARFLKTPFYRTSLVAASFFQGIPDLICDRFCLWIFQLWLMLMLLNFNYTEYFPPSGRVERAAVGLIIDNLHIQDGA